MIINRGFYINAILVHRNFYLRMKNIQWLIIFILASHGTLSSQIDYDNVKAPTNSIFINDVHLQQSPGKNLGLCDIIIRDGIHF